LPAEEVPPELPEPALGINFARDGMQEKDWLSLVAVHSDAWLQSVAFYFGARFGFDKADRYNSSFLQSFITLFSGSCFGCWIRICLGCMPLLLLNLCFLCGCIDLFVCIMYSVEI